MLCRDLGVEAPPYDKKVSTCLTIFKLIKVLFSYTTIPGFEVKYVQFVIIYIKSGQISNILRRGLL